MSSSVAQTELACVYSALILTDDGLEPDAVRSILTSAGYECESFWPKFFCEGIKGLDINALLTNVSSAPAASAAPSAAAVVDTSATGGKASKKEAEPEEESSDIGLGSMFD